VVCTNQKITKRLQKQGRRRRQRARACLREVLARGAEVVFEVAHRFAAWVVSGLVARASLIRLRRCACRMMHPGARTVRELLPLDRGAVPKREVGLPEEQTPAQAQRYRALHHLHQHEPRPRRANRIAEPRHQQHTHACQLHEVRRDQIHKKRKEYLLVQKANTVPSPGTRAAVGSSLEMNHTSEATREKNSRHANGNDETAYQ
jgi:hypothetical protein